MILTTSLFDIGTPEAFPAPLNMAAHVLGRSAETPEQA